MASDQQGRIEAPTLPGNRGVNSADSGGLAGSNILDSKAKDSKLAPDFQHSQEKQSLKFRPTAAVLRSFTFQNCFIRPYR